ncbi:expressed unknown protein [Seminavis robusta]|uniref:Uncharacterized protein n=1 Tax=Seminavis robusta TaxID=568900 RepID=A0A9N8EE26_9STRA|nr:expressed unknown protein [Seminavis robusta]|eukprot:Sro955_g224450.1 n/a (311) ;mRNA; f:31275-32207
MGIDPNSADYRNSKRPALDCLDVSGKQPNYFDMFTHATNPDLVTSDIVVLSNADQAFDSSLQWAKYIKNTTVLALSTWGFKAERVPSPTKDYFRFIHGSNSTEFQTEIEAKCRENYYSSWDAHVFHRTLVAGRLKPENFQRPTVNKLSNSNHSNSNHETAFFKMNENAAENSALWAIMKELPPPNDTPTDVHACTVIQTWHFHGAPKMHAHEDAYWYWEGTEETARPGVPKPHRWPQRDHSTLMNSFVVGFVPEEKAMVPMTSQQKKQIEVKQMMLELKKLERDRRPNGKKNRRKKALIEELQKAASEAV